MSIERPGESRGEVLGERVGAARRARRLSQEEVARHLGLSRPTVIAMEKGSRAIRPEEVDQLAELFGCSAHELVGRREFLADFTPQFRLTSAARVPRQSLSDAVRTFQELCEDYLTLEVLLDAPLPRSRYPDPYLIGGLGAAAAAEELAELERSRLNLGQGPLLRLLEVLEVEVGLRVFVVPLPEFRIAGMFRYTERLGGCVLVNGTHPATRQAWTAAHEYGHFLVHRDEGEITVLVDYERKPRGEQFADCFAASLLMPAGGLRQRFRSVVRSGGGFTVADLCWFASHYGVSVEAMTRRLERLGCIARGTWDRLSGEGFRGRQGQADLGITAPGPARLRLPDRFVRLAVQAFVSDKIGESRLARLLRCSRVEAREAAERVPYSNEVDERTGRAYQLSLDFGDRLELAAAERE